MLLAFLLPFLAAISPILAQTDIECPDGDLQTYLLSLIDALYSQGLTGFEDLLVTLSETDAGYQLLENLYTAPFLTILPPVDSALQLAGIQPPYSNVGNDTLANLFAYHTLQGEWGYRKLPQGPLKGVANTTLGMTGSDGGSTTAFKGQVMQQGDEGRVSIRMVVGNSTSWSGNVDLSAWPVLSNLRILPVDTVISLPLKLTDALKLPTSSRSPNGLTKFQSAFYPSGLAEVETVSQAGGYTFFIPMDDAFSAQTGTKETHYSSTGSVWSPQWSESGSYSGMTLDSGDQAAISYNGTGSYISIEGGSNAQILRSDIALENGVMHIIDTVLTGPGGTSTSLTDTPSNPDPNSYPNPDPNTLQPQTPPVLDPSASGAGASLTNPEVVPPGSATGAAGDTGGGGADTNPGGPRKGATPQETQAGEPVVVKNGAVSINARHGATLALAGIVWALLV